MDIIAHSFATPWVIGMLITLVVLICCSAVASASETALFSLRPTEVDEMESSGQRQVERIVRLLNDREYTLATILIFNNLVNVGIVLVSAFIISRTVEFRSPAWEFVFTSVVVTFILLLFGEILPKIYAAGNNVRFARFCAPVIAGLKVVFRPAAWLLVKTGSSIKGKGKENLSLSELSDALDVTRAQSDEEKQILEGIVSFAGREVSAIMKPRPDITALDADDGFDRVKEVIVATGYSRIPVYEENIDHIKGVLYVKDVVPHIAEKDDFEWTKLLRRAYFVPENKKIDDLLEEFQSDKIHVAIVVDEYGSTQGLVSLEDILEEIVGEISDESDNDTSLYTLTRAGEYIFEGKTNLGDVERILALDENFFDLVRGEADTLAGLMLEVRRGFLKKGESVEIAGGSSGSGNSGGSDGSSGSSNLRLTVLSLDGRRIEKIKLTVEN